MPPTCIRVIPDNSLPVTVAVGAAIGGFVLVVVVVLVIKMTCKKYSGQKFTKSVVDSDIDHTIELPSLFPISDIPTPVFENSMFMSSLHKLSEKGSFQIPRPTFVDPNIYSEYF
uniref:Uncharacterized protein n=1 Tax=Arion vulgaris TaxID=1028688 RepID=A0A0B6YD11_9EUPU